MSRIEHFCDFCDFRVTFLGVACRQEILEEIFEKNLWPMVRNLFNIPISLKYFLRSRNILKKISSKDF